MSLSLTLAAATSNALRVRVTGDANPQFTLRADGQMQWGENTSATTRISGDPVPASQSFVWRGYDAAGVHGAMTAVVELGSTLALTHAFGVRVLGDTFSRVTMGTAADGTGRIYFGSGSATPDVSFYRDSSTTIKTTADLECSGLKLTGLFDRISVIGVDVVGSRKTGWDAMSGTGARSGLNLETATTAQIGNRLKSLLDDLTSHGLIGT